MEKCGIDFKGKPIDPELLTKVERLWRYQFGGMPVHEMTCGSENCRESLCVGLQKESIFLFCKKCGYVQDWIPESLWAYFMITLSEDT